MRSCFTSFHKRVYNLVSLTTIEVESAHSVVHLLQRSTLIGVNLQLWKWSQRSLKEDNPVGGVLFYLPWSCRPHRYSNDITCTNSTIEYAEHEGLGANILVLRCVRWQKLELSRRTSIREKFSQVNRSASNCLTSRSSKEKKKTDEEEKGDIRVRFPSSDEESDESFLNEKTAYDDGHSIYLRETHYLRGRFFWRKYSLLQQNCVQLTFRNFPCYGSNGIAVTLFCFMHLLEGGSGDEINEKLKFQQSLLLSPLLTTDPSYVLHDKTMWNPPRILHPPLFPPRWVMVIGPWYVVIGKLAPKNPYVFTSLIIYSLFVLHTFL